MTATTAQEQDQDRDRPAGHPVGRPAAGGRVDYGAAPDAGVLGDHPGLRGWPAGTAGPRARPSALPGELSPAEGRALIDQVAGFGRPYPILVLTGGDCLLRADLFELVEYATSLGVPDRAVAVRHPGAHPGEVIERIATSGVKAVSISLDGASPATHDGVRGDRAATSRTPSPAIRALVDAGLTVQVNTTVMRANRATSWPTSPRWSPDTGAHIWEVFFLVHVGRGVAAGAITAEEHEDVCHFLYDASQYGFIVRTVEAPFFRRVVDRAAGRRPAAGRPRSTRRLAQRLTSAARTGPAPAQRAHRGHPGRQGHPVRRPRRRGVPGRVPAAGPGQPCASARCAEIYRDDPLLRRIRAAEFSGRCGSCPYADLCGGSRARAFAATGDPLGEDPACSFVPAVEALRP